jgi:hypothetical protein
MESASAQSKAANYSAQVAANNAKIANQNAEYATQAGQAKATSESLQSRAAMGAALSGAAANNLDVNTGSPAAVQQSERQVGELGTETTVNNAALQAYGYRSQSTSFTAQSSLDTSQAQSAITAGEFGAGGDLLSGASSVGSNWANYQLKAQNSGFPAAGGGGP